MRLLGAKESHKSASIILPALLGPLVGTSGFPFPVSLLFLGLGLRFFATRV